MHGNTQFYGQTGLAAAAFLRRLVESLQFRYPIRVLVEERDALPFTLTASFIRQMSRYDELSIPKDKQLCLSQLTTSRFTVHGLTEKTANYQHHQNGGTHSLRNYAARLPTGPRSYAYTPLPLVYPPYILAMLKLLKWSAPR